jgi:hypothetical protein
VTAGTASLLEGSGLAEDGLICHTPSWKKKEEKINKMK